MTSPTEFPAISGRERRFYESNWIALGADCGLRSDAPIIGISEGSTWRRRALRYFVVRSRRAALDIFLSGFFVSHSKTWREIDELSGGEELGFQREIPQPVTKLRDLLTLSYAKTPPKLIDGAFERGWTSINCNQMCFRILRIQSKHLTYASWHHMSYIAVHQIWFPLTLGDQMMNQLSERVLMPKVLAQSLPPLYWIQYNMG